MELHGILAETERRGITFDQLLTIPEQDEWVYNDGKSTTCSPLISRCIKQLEYLSRLQFHSSN
ncbi:hypothetical protein PHJA_002135200 [Phtheirospermum japonicum]|uniref:Uncharacterized protein n=1 Tax=Phtheirospermum japonicum TaxID=374723 RepID=A0A830D0N8_9LAMI|nr:hypothetical protein PHJA_002135200 [Phtheirospermum japonicum]